MPIDINDLPEGLARLAVGWHMVPADDPQLGRILSEQEVEALRARDSGTLVLVGNAAEVPPLPQQRIRGIVTTHGMVVRGTKDPDQTAIYSRRYVLRLTDNDVAVYEYPSYEQALAAAYRPSESGTSSPFDRATAARLDRAAAARLRRDLRRAQHLLGLARRSAGAHHTVLAAMREALQPIADASNELASAIAREALDRQQRTTAEMDADVADRQAVVDQLQSHIDAL